jgi:hypothetical protein
MTLIPTVQDPQSPKSLDRALKYTFDLPPSVNALYQRRRGGQVALTEAAHKYNEHVKGVVSRSLSQISGFPTTPDDVYSFEIRMYFERLENPLWFKTFAKGKDIGKRKAKTRYKTIDYDNRIKFLQDRVVEAVGIPNDSQVFVGHQEKHEDQENPRAEVIITVIPSDRFFKGGRHG